MVRRNIEQGKRKKGERKREWGESDGKKGCSLEKVEEGREKEGEREREWGERAVVRRAEETGDSGRKKEGGQREAVEVGRSVS